MDFMDVKGFLNDLEFYPVVDISRLLILRTEISSCGAPAESLVRYMIAPYPSRVKHKLAIGRSSIVNISTNISTSYIHITVINTMKQWIGKTSELPHNSSQRRHEQISHYRNSNKPQETVMAI